MTLTFLLSALAFLLVGGLGILSILSGTSAFSLATILRFFESSGGEALLILFGTLLLAVALYFISEMVRNRAAAARFSQEGEWGRIELSPYALREFISGILRCEIGIERFHVRLQHMEGGIAIAVRTALSPDEKVAEIGRRIQETLAGRVAERTGVEVKRVSVLVGSIRAHSGAQLKGNIEDKP
jgi:uncharacterized alkaline shock family protein YloU